MLNTIAVTPDEALQALKALYPLRLSARACAMLHGATGIGKSQTAQAFADAIDGVLIDMRLGQMLPEDLRGVPRVDPLTNTTAWCPINILPRSGRGVLLLDELTTARPELQNASLELLLDRRLGDYRLPDEFFVLAAGNAAHHGAAVFSLTTPVADRMYHFNVVADPESWLKWAMINEIAVEVLAFIKARPDLLEGNDARVTQDHIIGPSPRGWASVSEIIKNVPAGKTRDILIAGKVGLSAQIDLNHVLDELKNYPPVDKIMALSGRARMKVMPKTLSGLHALTYGLAYAVTNLETAQKALDVAVSIPEIQAEDPLPLAEIQRLAHELIMAKIQILKLTHQILRTKEYQAAKQFWMDVTAMAA